MKSAFTKKGTCTAKTIFTGEKIIEFLLTLINLTIKYCDIIHKAVPFLELQKEAYYE